jgi:hypothetical protein
MGTYPRGFSALAQRHRLLYLLAALLLSSSPLSAQQRRYLLELSAGGLNQSYDSVTGLKNAFGGVGRIGLWLPYQLSVELEGAFAGAKDRASNIGVNTRTITGSLLYNIALGNSAWAHLRAGAGETKFGDPCPGPEPGEPFRATICGNSFALVGGGGVRVGIAPTVLARGDLALTRHRAADRSFINVGVSLGLSYMVGSKPSPDNATGAALEHRRE